MKGDKEMSPGANGWETWAKYVLNELEQNKTDHQRIFDKLETVLIGIAKLKVKSGVWGFIGGAIPVLIGIAMVYFKMKGGSP